MMRMIEIMAGVNKLGTPESLDIPNQTLLSGPQLATFLGGVYFIAGIIAVIVIIIAGITYVTSSGDPNKTTKAKNQILYAAIGIMVIVTAFVITNFIQENAQ